MKLIPDFKKSFVFLLILKIIATSIVNDRVVRYRRLESFLGRIFAFMFRKFVIIGGAKLLEYYKLRRTRLFSVA